jgi:uncharacterized protein (TIGR02246 family)
MTKLIQINVNVLKSIGLVGLWLIVTHSTAGTPEDNRCAIVDMPSSTTDDGSLNQKYLQEIHSLFDQWRQAVLNGDTEAVANLVTADAVFWTHGAESLVGRQALADAFAPFFEQFTFIQDYTCHELIVRGDRAFVRGLERNKRIPHDGGEAVIVQQRAFSVLHRSADGQWRFARGMTNKSPE